MNNVDIKALANQTAQHTHSDDLISQFNEKYKVDPFRFDNLPGVSNSWDSKRLVQLYNWFIQEERAPQGQIAAALKVDNSTISRKIKSVDWEEFEARLEELCSISDEKYMKEAATAAREKALAGVAKRERRKEINREAYQMDLRERIADCTEAIKQAKLPPMKPIKKNQDRAAEEMILMLSDMHVGQEFSSAETGGINAFNLDICKKRAANLCRALIEIYTLHRELYDIPTLNIFGLGDFVHGSNLGGQWGPAYNTIPVNEQAKIASEIIAQMIDTWSQYFRRINFYGLIGNHGRAGAEKNSDKVSCNWDDVVYTYLKHRVANHKNVTVDHSPAWWTVREVNGKKFGAVHGDFISGSINGLTNEFDRLSNLIPAQFQYLLLGHFHRHTDVETSRGRLFVNGSFVGGDIHSMHQLKMKSKASQTVMGVHPSHGVTWTYHLDTDYERK